MPFVQQRKKTEDLEEGVLAFVPGATGSRINNVKKTIAWLRAQQVPTECIIYTYEELNLPDGELAPCTVIDNRGQKWMDHFMQVPLSMTKKKYILHIMDGIEVQSVDLVRMTKAIIDNDLVHAAPALYGKWRFPEMYPHLGFGRKVNYIEYHMDLFTRGNFACLQDLVASITTIDGRRATDNHLGWYVDDAMTFFCPGNLGVIDAMKMWKFAKGAYDYSDAAQMGKAWMDEHGWGDLNAEMDYSVPSEPLKGDLLPGDPQCNASISCACDFSNTSTTSCFLT